MKKELILLILTLLGLFSIILISINQPEISGKITAMETTKGTTTIEIENKTILVFENLKNKIEIGDQIKIKTKKSNNEIIATRIVKC